MQFEESISLASLSRHFLPDVKFIGDAQSSIRSFRSLQEPSDAWDAEAMTLILAKRVKDISEITGHSAATIITDFDPSSAGLSNWSAELARGKNIIFTKHARLQLAKFSHVFVQANLKFRAVEGRDGTYFVATGAHIDEGAEIGAGTRVHSQAVIYRGVRIGRNCTIQSGAVIGADGFGFEKDLDGSWTRIHHLGGVSIGNDVEIGSNACVDRGTLEDTRIDDNVKIDNLVHIAHNVHIKRNCLIIALSQIAGGVVVEENTWIAPCSCVKEKVKIGANSFVGLGSVVIRDLPSEAKVFGVPAQAIRAPQAKV